MAEFSMPFDAVEVEPNVYDREYNALEFAKYLGGLVETGVMRGALQELKLSNTGANMQTILATGIAYIAVNGAVHYYENDSPLTLTHDTESIGVSRIDRIVLRLDLNTNERQIKAVIKKGVAAASPVAPALTQNNVVHEISIGQVVITGGQTFIAANAITQHVGTVTAWATSKILPNYNDDTLQAVLDAVNAHKDNPVIHTPYGVAGGSANAKTVTVSPAPTSLVDGMAVVFKNSTANTGAVTLNVNGLGAKSIVKANGSALQASNLKVNSIYTVRYNATTQSFILQGEGGEDYYTSEELDVEQSTGTILAQTSYSQSGSDTLLATDSQDNVYVFSRVLNTSTQQHSTSIKKYDSNLTLLWTRSLAHSYLNLEHLQLDSIDDTLFLRVRQQDNTGHGMMFVINSEGSLVKSQNITLSTSGTFILRDIYINKFNKSIEIMFEGTSSDSNFHIIQRYNSNFDKITEKRSNQNENAGTITSTNNYVYTLNYSGVVRQYNKSALTKVWEKSVANGSHLLSIPATDDCFLRSNVNNISLIRVPSVSSQSHQIVKTFSGNQQLSTNGKLITSYGQSPIETFSPKMTSYGASETVLSAIAFAFSSKFIYAVNTSNQLLKLLPFNKYKVLI